MMSDLLGSGSSGAGGVGAEADAGGVVREGSAGGGGGSSARADAVTSRVSPAAIDAYFLSGTERQDRGAAKASMVDRKKPRRHHVLSARGAE
jgi:hypothetical protein